MDPMQLIQQLMQQGGESIPGPKMQGQLPPATAMPDAESVAPTATDEDMLDTVHNAMGVGAIKGENLEMDQTALEADPTPENIQAFIGFWGRDQLPTNVQDEES